MCFDTHFQTSIQSFRGKQHKKKHLKNSHGHSSWQVSPGLEYCQNEIAQGRKIMIRRSVFHFSRFFTADLEIRAQPQCTVFYHLSPGSARRTPQYQSHHLRRHISTSRHPGRRGVCLAFRVAVWCASIDPSTGLFRLACCCSISLTVTLTKLPAAT